MEHLNGPQTKFIGDSLYKHPVHISAGYDYPQNLLRNVARAASLSHYTASLDVDVLLAPGMTRPLATFLNGNTCNNCVFVIPTYEVSTIHD